MDTNKVFAAVALAALYGVAPAQALFERAIDKPVEPGQVAPHREPAAAPRDAAAAPMLHVPAPAGSTLKDWYVGQGRPVVVLFFDRRLDSLPPGWDGSARLMIARDREADGKTETENLSIALERKAPRRSLQGRAPVVRLVENALLRELQRSRFRLVDPSLAERALAAKAAGKTDTEFESLQRSAAYILEVELAATDGAVSMVGGFKRIAGGEIVATVRAPVEHDLHDPAAADALARRFVRQLLAFEPAT